MIGGKKGIGVSTLAVLILFLSIFLVLIAFTGGIKNFLQERSDVEVCRLSAIAQAKTKPAGLDVTKVSLKCPRRQVKFFEDRVEINGKRMRKYKFNKLDSNTVNKVVAEELRLCWYMMGEGELNVFRANLVVNENACVICSEIGFDKSVGKQTFSGLVDFLKTEKIPNSDEYYIDYLVKSQRNMYLTVPFVGLLPWTQYGPWGYGTTNFIEDESKRQKPDTTSFDTSKQYVIYFLGFKPGIVNSVLQAFDSAYYIGLGEPEKAVKECQRIVN
jgi:hypothetical protein